MATGLGVPEKSNTFQNWNNDVRQDNTLRYSRQLILSSFGAKGQLSLQENSVLVVGVGGLGSSAALYLAGSGIGRIGIVDRDNVELSNLHRQVIHDESKLGWHKAKSAAESCRKLNSSIKIDVYLDGVSPSNAIELVSKYSIILDCTDNAETRYLLNDVCILTNRPLVSGAAIGVEGQLTIYGYHNGPCYRCLFPEPPPQSACQSCSDFGVLGVVPGIIGSMQALEAIKLASGIGSVLSGKLMLFDALSTSWRTVKLRGKQPNCAVCGENPLITASSLSSYDYHFFTNGGPISKCEVLPSEQSISVKELEHLLVEGKVSNFGPNLLLDVRESHQYEIVSLKPSINIPLAKLERRFKEILEYLGSSTVGETSKEKRILVMCRRGNDSRKAVALLRSKGLTNSFDVSDAGIHVVKEAPITFTVATDVADILYTQPTFYSLGGHTVTCVDVIGASPMSCGNGVDSKGFKAFDQAVARKYSKHRHACSNQGYTRIRFGFVTFDCLSPLNSLTTKPFEV